MSKSENKPKCGFITKKGNACTQIAIRDGWCGIHHPDNIKRQSKPLQTTELKRIESFDDALHNLYTIAQAAFNDLRWDPAVKAVKVAAELLNARDSARGQIDLSKLSDSELEALKGKSK